MTCPEALAWLYETQLFGIKLGLANVRRLLAALDHPERRGRFLHVAGTNGKGSVCAMMESVLRADGVRTGLYTSPHLVDFRERIRVNGEKISESDLAAGLTRIRGVVEGWDPFPTFFEISTVLALAHFARAGCEAVVLETGLGGRLDATNAVTPVVSVLTPIAMDHEKWLGDSLEKITAEKAGIIKPGIPVASAPQLPEAEAVIRAAAAARGSALEFASGPLETESFTLAGGHQKDNAALAVRALELAGWKPSAEALRRGLGSVQWPGRFQIVRDRYVLDGAHNPHAATRLVQTWREKFGAARATVIFGALGDKDARGMLQALEPIAEKFVFVPVQSQRAKPPESLPELTGRPSRVAPSVREAIAAEQGLILITGSLFLVGEALEILGVEI